MALLYLLRWKLLLSGVLPKRGTQKACIQEVGSNEVMHTAMKNVSFEVVLARRRTTSLSSRNRLLLERT